eukprot:CAMPEP_0181473972 /NCGR_PEP_ID=MMETSP1110-20121109/40402_1 /TAXON_ID=174948 /ORGANISM="Symbiodinium sp., Strain CCMP421" /LENGTH=50 /DNA_ID=CAMNT_0023599111 /DNA_START=67 /DNA_END=215 /DNA_ORIENTATION=-
MTRTIPHDDCSEILPEEGPVREALKFGEDELEPNESCEVTVQNPPPLDTV